MNIKLKAINTLECLNNFDVKDLSAIYFCDAFVEGYYKAVLKGKISVVANSTQLNRLRIGLKKGDFNSLEIYNGDVSYTITKESEDDYPFRFENFFGDVQRDLLDTLINLKGF